jgi:hypothetical protein
MIINVHLKRAVKNKLFGIGFSGLNCRVLLCTGRLVEDMENKIRSTLNEIYFGKTRDIVNGLRSVQPLAEARKTKDLQVTETPIIYCIPKLSFSSFMSSRDGQNSVQMEAEKCFIGLTVCSTGVSNVHSTRTVYGLKQRICVITSCQDCCHKFVLQRYCT